MATHDEPSPIEVLAERIATDAASVRRELRVYRILAVLSVAVIVVNVLLMVGMFRTLSTAQATLTEVKSCTTPEGECSRRGAQRTADVVHQLLVATAKVVECANFSPNTAVFRECVHRELGVDLGAAR